MNNVIQDLDGWIQSVRTLIFSLQTFSRLFLESPQKLHKPCAEKREQWPPPGLTLKKQKNGPEIFFHWFPLVVSGGGCGTDADTLPTIAACSKLHIHQCKAGQATFLCLEEKRAHAGGKWRKTLYSFSGEKNYIFGNYEGEP